MIASFSVNNWRNKDEISICKESSSQRTPLYKNNKISKDATSKSTPTLSLDSFQYEIHDPIWIGDNSDFSELGFPGSGTSNDPYIISGYSITSSTSPLIEIRNTNVYFEIKNNQISGVSRSVPGIHLQNVNYGSIINNVVHSCVDGIFLESASLNTILNNRVSSSLGGGIWMTSNSNANFVSSNIIFDNDNNGIELGPGVCNDNIIFNNTCYNNINNGIWMNSFSNTTLTYNNIYNNGFGFNLEVSSNGNTIGYNTIQNNEQFGIQIGSSSDNSVNKNDFLDNNHEGIFQAYDIGWNNVFSNNYWNDWTSPDSDTDGIVDNPYPISGSANNKDNFPLVYPYSLHYLTELTVIYPNGGETLSGTIEIEWSSSSYSFSNPVSYSVYYSNNNGSSWSPLSSDLTTLSCLWDTTTVPDGSNYLIKVEEKFPGGIKTTAISDGTFNIQNMPSLITTIILPIPVVIVSLGMLFWINKRVFRIIEEKNN